MAELRQDGATTTIDGLTATYRPQDGVYDEMMTPEGVVRPHWQPLIERLQAMPAAELAERRATTERLLRESGIAFNVYADPDDRAHAWRLGTLPVIIPTAEWQQLEAAVVQRAQLLDAVLADLYGQGTLLQEGLLPPALVFGSPDYLRPCVQRDGQQRRFIDLYAVDVARTADGRWQVLSDQTEIATGAGFALANRVAMSHGFEELFRDCRARRLANFFQDVRGSLLACLSRDDGQIALLSRGPDSPFYFSNAYMARYLGYTLVQSDDLTVRDDQVYVMTLDGLQRVDLIVRQTFGAGCDPLELPSQTDLGLAGLVRAARSGRVQIANALGSGLLENPGFAPYLPGLCQRLLQQDLKLESAPAFWLGDPEMRAAALERADELWLDDRQEPGETKSTAWRAIAAMTPAERAALPTRLEQVGHRLTARMPVSLATTPTSKGERWQPAPFAVRLFVSAMGDDGYSVMPGGLVRLSNQPAAVSLPNGRGSKDCWVISDQPVGPVFSPFGSAGGAIQLRRAGRDLLSRTADNLFWLGRYAERAEGIMRMLRSVLVRMVEDSTTGGEPELLQRLLDIQLDKGPALEPDDPAVTPLDPLAWRVRTLMSDPDRSYGLAEELRQLHRTATLARDQISHDAWRTLNELRIEPRFRRVVHWSTSGPALDLLNEGLRLLSAFSGTETENMTRNDAWRFLEIGRRIERAGHVVDLHRGLVVESEDPEHSGSLQLLLELLDSFMTYRSRYIMTPLLVPVIDLSLLDETNPRGVAFQLVALQEQLDRLPRKSQQPQRSPEQRLILGLTTEVRLADPGDLVRSADESVDSSGLAELLDRISAALPQISNHLGRSYFVHAEARRTSGS